MLNKTINPLETVEELLENIVKETGVVKIILDYKKQMESVYCIICQMACESHHCAQCVCCNKWCCYNHQMEHEMACEFD